MHRRWGGVALVAVSALCCGNAHALNDVYANDKVRVTAMGPEWTWQKQGINLMFVLENTSDTPETVTIELVPPQGREDHFHYEDRAALTFEETLDPGATKRHAITGIQARDGVARQTYEFTVQVTNDGVQGEIAYPLRTVRGAAVSAGKAAAYVPAFLGVLWCFVVVAILRRHGKRGAWKRSGDPVTETDAKPDWVEDTPE